MKESNKYTDIALGTVKGRWLAKKVEERWPEWEDICKRYHFKKTPEKIFSEVVWSVGYELGTRPVRTGVGKQARPVASEGAGSTSFSLVRYAEGGVGKGISEVEYRVLDAWLDSLYV